MSTAVCRYQTLERHFISSRLVGSYMEGVANLISADVFLFSYVLGCLTLQGLTT